MVYLNDYEKKERIREIYNLAYSLTGDFRLLEEEIRKMDKTLRVQMIDDNLSKGELLQKYLNKKTYLPKLMRVVHLMDFFICYPMTIA